MKTLYATKKRLYLVLYRLFQCHWVLLLRQLVVGLV